MWPPQVYGLRRFRVPLRPDFQKPGSNDEVCVYVEGRGGGVKRGLSPAIAVSLSTCAAALACRSHHQKALQNKRCNQAASLPLFETTRAVDL